MSLYTSFYLFSYAGIGALFPLIGQYLAGLGFTGGEIGVVTALSTAIGIFSNSLWGSVYHGLGRDKRLTAGLAVATALLAPLLLTLRTFPLFLAGYMVVFFFENPVFPLIDAAVLERDHPFGQARKWGAVGFAAGIGIAGFAADRFGLETAFILFSLGFGLTGAALLYGRKAMRQSAPPRAHVPGSFDAIMEEIESETDDLPTIASPMVGARTEEPDPSTSDAPRVGERASGTEGHAEKRGAAVKTGAAWRELLGNRKFLAIVASAFFIIGPSLAQNIYFSFLFVDQGGTLAGMGIALLLMAVSEAPFMAWTSRLSDRFTPERMILVAMLVSALRFLWYGTGPSWVWLTGTFFLQGFVNGIVLVESIRYVARVVRPEILPLAVPLFNALSSNCGTIVCQLVGGLIVGRWGGVGVYRFYGWFNVAGIAIYLAAGLQRSNRDKRDK